MIDETRLNALQLADIHLDALYECDDAGLITGSRDPSATPPKFHLVRTAPGNRFLLRKELSSSQCERLIAVLSSQPASACDYAETAPPNLEALRAVLAADSPPRAEYRGPAFFFPQQLVGSRGAELLTDLSSAPADGRFSWLRQSRDSIRPVTLVHADNGEIASVCHSARSTSRAVEAGVETLEEFRGRGYGTAAVAAWAAAVRRGGRVPLFSTEWENEASRALARKLNLICYGEDLHLG